MEYNFDPKEEIRDVAPAIGWHNLQMVAVRTAPSTKTGGTNGYFDFKVIDGEDAGKVSTLTIVLESPNLKAVSLGKKKLQNMCLAMKTGKIANLEELTGRYCTGRIAPSDYNGKTYFNLEEFGEIGEDTKKNLIDDEIPF